VKFLKALLFSLHRMKEPEGGVSYIFVDNASSDGTADYIAEHFSRAIIIREQNNLGFSAANNHGIRHEAARDAEYIALLNPDTVVTEDWLINILPVFDTERSIASAQPLLLYGQDKEKINSAGNKIHFLGFGFTDGNGVRWTSPSPPSQGGDNRLSPPYEGGVQEGVKPIAYASGAAVVYRKQCLEEINLSTWLRAGPFDEDLFMYHDDLDVGWKFLLRGYHNVLVPSSIVYHHYEFSRSIKKYYWMERNRLMMLVTHYDYRTLFMVLPAFLVLELGLTFFSLLRGFFVSRVRAYGWLLIHIPLLIKKHGHIQRLRKIGDRDILKMFTGRISHQEISNPIVEYLMNPIFSAYFYLLRKLIFW